MGLPLAGPLVDDWTLAELVGGMQPWGGEGRGGGVGQNGVVTNHKSQQLMKQSHHKQARLLSVMLHISLKIAALKESQA